MLDRLVDSSVLQADHRVLSEGHHVGQEKAVRRFDLVLGVFCGRRAARPDRVSRERQRHVLSAPVVPAAAPFLGSGPLALGASAVVKEEARIALERLQVCAVGKDERGADEAARPVPASLRLARVEEDEVPAPLRNAVVVVACVEVSHVIGSLV